MSRFLQAIEWEESNSDWSIAQYDRVKTGDKFFMLKVGIGMCGIVASGKITSDPTPGKNWSGRVRKSHKFHPGEYGDSENVQGAFPAKIASTIGGAGNT